MHRSSSKKFARTLLLPLLLVLAQAQGANLPPTADADSDQTVGIANAVQLNGQKSSDPDGNIKSYRWIQLKGQKIKLLNPKTATPSFTTPGTLPSKQSNRTLIFKLTVSDNKNKKASDTVTVNLVSCTPPKFLVNGSCQTPPPVCYPPKKWQNGQCLPPPPLTCKPPLVPIDGACRFAPVVCTLPNVAQNGVCAIPVASTLLNDTGFTLCSDTEINGDFCPIGNYPGQDAEFGRDNLLNDDSDGHAGFSFVKLDANGSPLPVEATDWQCIKDNVTGLIWENKTTDGSWQNKNQLFVVGNPIGQQVSLDQFISSVNGSRLCGADDWRLPTAQELLGIIDFGISYPGPAIDSRFFANTANDIYWSSSSHPNDPTQIWVVYFDDGRVFRDNLGRQLRARLVRDSRINPTQ